MCIRPQNMPQTSNSLLLPPESMVATNGNQGQTVMHIQSSETIKHL